MPNAKKRGGRPAFAATDEQRYSVNLMAGIGIPQEDIAAAIGITRVTLRKHFRSELDTGRVRTITKVADSLVRQALAGNMTAAIFYLKTQAGWTETSRLEHAGRIDVQQLGKLSDSELEELAGELGLSGE